MSVGFWRSETVLPVKQPSTVNYSMRPLRLSHTRGFWRFATFLKTPASRIRELAISKLKRELTISKHFHSNTFKQGFQQHRFTILCKDLDSVVMSGVGAVVRALAFHQCVLGSIPGPGVICGLSLLVLYSAPRGFSPGTPVFPSP